MASKTPGVSLEQQFSGKPGMMKDFGFGASIEGYDSKPSAAPPTAAARPTSARNEKITTPAYAEGGEVAPHMHPHGHNVHRVEQDTMDGAVVHHHAHGGMTRFHQDGTISHQTADGQEAIGGSAHSYQDGGSVNVHPHGQAVTHSETMADREVHRHSHGGFTVDYHDGRPTTHHGKDGTPVYHAGGSAHTYEQGGDVGLKRGGHVRRHGARHPKEQPMTDAMPINRPPRNPQRNPSPHNEMPGGVLNYGVQPSAEPPVSDGSMGALPPRARGKPRQDQAEPADGMKRGGAVRKADGGAMKDNANSGWTGKAPDTRGMSVEQEARALKSKSNVPFQKRMVPESAETKMSRGVQEMGGFLDRMNPVKNLKKVNEALQRK